MKKETKYALRDAPKWIEPITDSVLLSLCAETEATTRIKNAGRGVFYLYKHQIHTSPEKNQQHYFRAWGLSNADILQASSVNEFFVNDNEHIEIYRASMIRDGRVIDKKQALTIRVLDEETGSQRGSINKIKKCIA